MFKPTEEELRTILCRLRPLFVRGSFLSDDIDEAIFLDRLGYLIEQAQAERLTGGITGIGSGDNI